MWSITYSTYQDGSNAQTVTISAATYTEALIYFTIKYKNAIAIDLIKII